MRISTVCCARTPNLEIAFFSGDFLTAGGAFPWHRQDRNGATLDFALAQSPEGKVCGDEKGITSEAFFHVMIAKGERLLLGGECVRYADSRGAASAHT